MEEGSFYTRSSLSPLSTEGNSIRSSRVSVVVFACNKISTNVREIESIDGASSIAEGKVGKERKAHHQ